MRNLFSQVLNMSMTGSIVILLVMLARLMLKRSPKIFSYALWLVVLFRLLCPVALTGPVSVLNVLKPEGQAATEATSVIQMPPLFRQKIPPQRQFHSLSLPDIRNRTSCSQFPMSGLQERG